MTEKPNLSLEEIKYLIDGTIIRIEKILEVSEQHGKYDKMSLLETRRILFRQRDEIKLLLRQQN